MRSILDTGSRPLQQLDELHQKDLRINHVLVHIWGLVWRVDPEGGHYSSLVPNRRVLRVRRVTFTPTCRYFSHTAVSTFRLLTVSQNMTVLLNLGHVLLNYGH